MKVAEQQHLKPFKILKSFSEVIISQASDSSCFNAFTAEELQRSQYSIKILAWLSDSLDVDLVLLLVYHGRAGLLPPFGRECCLGLTP